MENGSHAQKEWAEKAATAADGLASYPITGGNIEKKKKKKENLGTEKLVSLAQHNRCRIELTYQTLVHLSIELMGYKEERSRP